jgi:hypothetical protein
MSTTQFKVANGETRYIEVPVKSGTVGFHLAWLDAVSSATITLELTGYKAISATAPGRAWEWKDSGLTITGPVAAAAGSAQVNVENVRQERARIKIVGAAASWFDLQPPFALPSAAAAVE